MTTTTITTGAPARRPAGRWASLLQTALAGALLLAPLLAVTPAHAEKARKKGEAAQADTGGRAGAAGATTPGGAATPAAGEATPAADPDKGVTPTGTVNLNDATEDQLMLLPGVGPSKAAAIVAWRTKHGRFKKVEDLTRVKGFGRKTLQKLRSSLALTGPTTYRGKKNPPGDAFLATPPDSAP